MLTGTSPILAQAIVQAMGVVTPNMPPEQAQSIINAWNTICEKIVSHIVANAVVIVPSGTPVIINPGAVTACGAGIGTITTATGITTAPTQGTIM